MIIEDNFRQEFYNKIKKGDKVSLKSFLLHFHVISASECGSNRFSRHGCIMHDDDFDGNNAIYL